MSFRSTLASLALSRSAAAVGRTVAWRASFEPRLEALVPFSGEITGRLQQDLTARWVDVVEWYPALDAAQVSAKLRQLKDLAEENPEVDTSRPAVPWTAPPA